MRPLNTFFYPLLLAALALAGWEGACRWLHVPPYLLPAPSAIAQAILAEGSALGAAALRTLEVALLALVIAAAAAIGLALLCRSSEVAASTVRPVASALQVTPVVAIAPLFVIWAGVDHPGRALVALAAIVAFFPLFSGALAGLDAADENLQLLFKLHHATRRQRLFRLELPSAVPFLLEGFKVAAGLAIVGSVVAEFVAGSGADQGLAWRILEAGNRLRTADMFAALVVLSAMAALLNTLLGVAQKRLLRWWRG